MSTRETESSIPFSELNPKQKEIIGGFAAIYGAMRANMRGAGLGKSSLKVTESFPGGKVISDSRGGEVITHVKIGNKGKFRVDLQK
jgi:hypothetical protein